MSPEKLTYYHPQDHEEVEIDREKVENAVRVLREITELESDSDHIQSAVNMWEDLNRDIYGTPIWPDDQEVEISDVEDALEVADELVVDHMKSEINLMYYDIEPEGVHYRKILEEEE